MSTRRLPADCSNLTELRAEIDALDTELFDRFAERLSYIHRAAELKRGTDVPADVPARVRQVVENAERRAAERGLDPDLYGRIWTLIVEAAIAEEEKRLGH